MKKQFNYLLTLVVLALSAVFAACSADDHKLVTPGFAPEELVEGVAYMVEHDASNPNIIHLKSLLGDNYRTSWETPQGTVNGNDVALQMPFPGDYEVRFGVSTVGGYVWSEPTPFTIDEMCTDFIQSDAWRMLTGGVGHSKRWILDIDAKGVSRNKYGYGPGGFWDAAFTRDKLYGAKGGNFWDGLPGDKAWDYAEAIDPEPAGENWNWMPGPDQDWFIAMADFGAIEFSLDGGAFMKNYDNAGGVASEGTFMLDDNKFILTTGYAIQPVLKQIGGTIDDRLGDTREWDVFYLSDDFMCITSKNTTTGERIGLHFISEDYKNNWTPKETRKLPKGWLDRFCAQNLYQSWELDLEEPIAWFSNAGKRISGIEVPAIKVIEDAMPLYFNNSGVTTPAPRASISGSYTFNDIDGAEHKGNFSCDSIGNLVFENGLGNSILTDNGIALTGNSFTVLQVIDSDEVEGTIGKIWFGVPQYNQLGQQINFLAFGFKQVVSGEGPKKEYEVNLAFNNTSWGNNPIAKLAISSEGTYSIAIDVTESDPYLLYLDVLKFLRDYPNGDIYLNSVKVDGTDIGMTDADVERGTGDDATTARRYILNPWNTASVPWTPKFVVKSKIEVSFTVKFDNGTPFIPKAD